MIPIKSLLICVSRASSEYKLTGSTPSLRECTSVVPKCALAGETPPCLPIKQLAEVPLSVSKLMGISSAFKKPVQ